MLKTAVNPDGLPIDAFDKIRAGVLAGFKAVIDCIKAFSETDFTEDLREFAVPTLIMHSDDDQINADLLAFLKA